MSLVLREVSIDRRDGNGLDYLLQDGQEFRFDYGGVAQITLYLHDTRKGGELRVVLEGHIVSQDFKKTYREYSEVEALKQEINKLRHNVESQRNTIQKLNQKMEPFEDGIVVDAGPDDEMIVVPAKFQGSMEFALEDAGLKKQKVKEDVFRLVEDTEEDVEGDVDNSYWCHGFAPFPHPPVRMVQREDAMACPRCFMEKRL